MSSVIIKNREPMEFQKKLYNQFNIQVPIIKWDDKILLRISMQAYNTMEDIDKLIFALRKIY